MSEESDEDSDTFHWVRVSDFETSATKKVDLVERIIGEDLYGVTDSACGEDETIGGDGIIAYVINEDVGGRIAASLEIEDMIDQLIDVLVNNVGVNEKGELNSPSLAMAFFSVARGLCRRDEPVTLSEAARNELDKIVPDEFLRLRKHIMLGRQKT